MTGSLPGCKHQLSHLALRDIPEIGNSPVSIFLTQVLVQIPP